VLLYVIEINGDLVAGQVMKCSNQPYPGHARVRHPVPVTAETGNEW